MTEVIYTESQATDEAVLLLVRKLRRLHPAAYVDLTARLPEGAQTALHAADIRADTLRETDKRDGITRTYQPEPEFDEDEE